MQRTGSQFALHLTKGKKSPKTYLSERKKGFFLFNRFRVVSSVYASGGYSLRV